MKHLRRIWDDLVFLIGFATGIVLIFLSIYHA